MRYILFLFGLFLSTYVCSEHCKLKVEGYKILDNSVYPFLVNGKKACFFAFYTKNPDPFSDVKGNGNLGDTLWYGYYLIHDPLIVYEFHKPVDILWRSICELNAVSFRPMLNDTDRNVTIIGACDKQNLMSYTFPMIFKWQKDKFILDDDVYTSLFGIPALTIDDIKAYIKSPGPQYDILVNRSKPDNP